MPEIYTVNITPNSAEQIIRQNLTYHLDILRDYLKSRMSPEFGAGGYFDTDKEKDIAELNAYIEAFIRVLEYYSEPEISYE